MTIRKVEDYGRSLRMALNISDDLMQSLKRQADAQHQSISFIVNEIVETHLYGSVRREEPLRQQTHPLGARPGSNLHKSLGLAAEMETGYTIDKLELGK